MYPVRSFSRGVLKKATKTEAIVSRNEDSLARTKLNDDVHLSGLGWYVNKLVEAGEERGKHAENGRKFMGGRRFMSERTLVSPVYARADPTAEDLRSNTAVLVNLLQALVKTKGFRQNSRSETSLCFCVPGVSKVKIGCFVLSSGRSSLEQDGLRLYVATDRQRSISRLRRSSTFGSEHHLRTETARGTIKQALLRFLSSTRFVLSPSRPLRAVFSSGGGAKAAQHEVAAETDAAIKQLTLDRQRAPIQSPAAENAVEVSPLAEAEATEAAQVAPRRRTAARSAASASSNCSAELVPELGEKFDYALVVHRCRYMRR